MKNKECITCKEIQPLSEYYKHKQMADGHLNKCKTCAKSQAKNRHHKLSENKEWVKSERRRHSDKYYRLGYKEKQVEWDLNRPWKNTSEYKNLSRDLKIPKGLEAHHWSYNKEDLRDIFAMHPSDHKSLHQLIELDEDRLLFKIIETGEYLRTRKDHEDFMVSKGYTHKIIIHE